MASAYFIVDLFNDTLTEMSIIFGYQWVWWYFNKIKRKLTINYTLDLIHYLPVLIRLAKSLGDLPWSSSSWGKVNRRLPDEDSPFGSFKRGGVSRHFSSLSIYRVGNWSRKHWNDLRSSESMYPYKSESIEVHPWFHLYQNVTQSIRNGF